MSATMEIDRPGQSVPDIGPWVPTAMVHIGFIAVSAGLCFVVLPTPFWLAVGIFLAFAGILVPDLAPTWCLGLLLGLSQIWREPAVADVTFYLLLAGVHLLHVIGGLCRVLPWAGRMQLGAFLPSFRRYAIVQLAVQPVAVCTLLMLGGPGGGAIRGVSILSAAVVGILALLLVRRINQPGAAE